MLRINPATAQLLLEDHVALAPGDWVIQNVANSAVGRHLIVLAKAQGVRTINVVRRDDVAAELRGLGADVVLTDGADLAERARTAAGDAPIRLGIDAVSGAATKRIADSVADGGVVVSYGSMTGEDPVMSRAAMSFRAVGLTSFNLGRGLAKRPPQQVRALYADLAAKVRDGVLKAPVDSTYPIEDIGQASPAVVAAACGGLEDDWLQLYEIWSTAFGARLVQISEHGMALRVRMLGGTQVGYARVTRRWWQQVTGLMRSESLLDRPVYFVSSNSHAIANLLTGVAPRHADELAAAVDDRNQVWVGTITNPRAKPVNTSQKPAVAAAAGNGVVATSRSARSDVCAPLCTMTRRNPVARRATLISRAAPARAAARSRPWPPKQRIRRYSGTTCMAKNIRKSTRSVAHSAPLTAVSRSRSSPQ